MGKSRGSIQQAIETFSLQMEQKHTSPGKFIEGIRSLLGSKKKRGTADDYKRSLEKNVSYLYYFAEGAKAILELMIQRINDDGKFLEFDPGLTLSELEGRVRDKISLNDSGIEEISEFSELLKKRESEPVVYIKELEFNYSYLMAVRGFAVDFMNLLYALQTEYYMEDVDYTTGDQVWSYIEMIANYYIGNIKIGKGE